MRTLVDIPEQDLKLLNTVSKTEKIHGRSSFVRPLQRTWRLARRSGQA